MSGQFIVVEVDVLVNNVGDVSREQMSWRDISPQEIDHILAVDVKGTMLVTHEVGRRCTTLSRPRRSSTSARASS